MEHDEKPLPIDIRLLGALAEKVNSFLLLYIYLYVFYYVFSWGVGKIVVSNSAILGFRRNLNDLEVVEFASLMEKSESARFSL